MSFVKWMSLIITFGSYARKMLLDDNLRILQVDEEIYTIYYKKLLNWLYVNIARELKTGQCVSNLILELEENELLILKKMIWRERYRSNACPICLVCFVCVKVYGEGCLCQPIELNRKSKKGIEYKLNFRNKHITRTGANKQKKKYDQELVNWFL
ncbi:hypothetical protein C2G38_2183933 [Gigaspora rosea]|uniref:Uncharacterized protein n=1 Tax=Gigaspora rosea TaxID=44941 RepID=A0A397VAG6_9GLOM|nr:hypothetical protein C2G38_2183933 [Gigaspora rosea]